MKHLYAILFTILAAVQGYAQANWAWAKADTTISVTGYYNQVVAAAPSRVLWSQLTKSKYAVTPAAFGDNKLTEYDLAGNALTSVALTGKVVIIDMQADAMGNWYVLGKYQDSLQYGSFLQVNSNVTGPYHFVMKLASGSLQMQWYTPIGTNYYASASSMSIRGSNLYVPVDSYGNTTIYKMDIATGNRTAVARQVKAGYTSSVVADDNGNVYVAGSCPQGYLVDTFGNTPKYIGQPYYAYIIRYKKTGDYDWGIFMNDITCTPRRLNIADNNTIYYTGGLHDTLSIGGFKIAKPWVMSGANYIAASLDSTGAVRWVKQIKDSIISRADLENIFAATVVDNMLVVAPTMHGYADFGNGVTGSYGTQAAASVVAYKADGTTLWQKQTDAISAVCQHITGNGAGIWLTGIARDSSSLDLDTVSAPLKQLVSAAFLARINTGVCEAPNIKLTNMGANAGIAYWDSISGANAYEFIVSLNPPPYSFGAIIYNTQVVLAGLVPGNPYWICARTICANGSRSDWSCANYTPLGIGSTVNGALINIYPNPATQELNIGGLDKAGGAVQLKIAGITGNVIFSRSIGAPSSNERIDVAQYARGIYFVEINTTKGKTVQKLVLE